MKPEHHSNTLLGITRSKAKMFEFGVDLDDHINVPKDPARLFPLALGMLGELAVATNEELVQLDQNESQRIARFAAHFIEAYKNGQFRPDHDPYYSILSAAGYYLSDLPGSAQVLVNSLEDAYPALGCEGLEALVIWLVRSRHTEFNSRNAGGAYVAEILDAVGALDEFFRNGIDPSVLRVRLNQLRSSVYSSGTARQLLMVDLACAVARVNVYHSARYCLPNMSGLSEATWASALLQPNFIRGLWPAQRLLGEQGVFSGNSAVIQMPTSAGKTRSTEIIIRSAFLSGRTSLAVIVAPFRALCHEISQQLALAFRGENVSVNEPSDVLQSDFALEVQDNRRSILVTTPEKLLYITRQEPGITSRMGLVIYDEGHQFDNGIRGVTYELLLTSLKERLSPDAQVLLISAVIGNGEDVRNWLIGERGSVINGLTLSPTARAVGFFSSVRGTGQLQFVAESDPREQDFFVPRILRNETLTPVGTDRNDGFPNRTDGKDIALSLGSRLAPQGSVAVFCGRKDSVPTLCKRALAVHERGVEAMDISKFSSANKIARLANLYAAHLGEESIACRVSKLGIVTHHRNVPEGLRVAVEYAVRERLIVFVICTSTLAQGVNLPIRYLLVTTVYQGKSVMRTRDFQNLMGRVGRSGMFTEGSVIFTDPQLYDLRQTQNDGWRFDRVSKLLSAKSAEPSESSLLGVLLPVENERKTQQLVLNTLELAQAYISDSGSLAELALEIATRLKDQGFELVETKRQLDHKVAIFGAIESFLMANWDENEFALATGGIANLAKQTFAYSIATDPQKAELQALFELLGTNVATRIPDSETRQRFGRSLYGVAESLNMEQWVRANFASMSECNDTTELLSCVWSILRGSIINGNIRKAESDQSVRELALGWIGGQTYVQLFTTASAGEMILRTPKRMRKVKLEDVIDMCEGGLAYDGALCLGALAGLTELIAPDATGLVGNLKLLQKRLRYGLEKWRIINIYEAGFTDRVIAKELDEAIREVRGVRSIEAEIVRNREAAGVVLTKYPSYFEAVLNRLGSPE